MHARAHTRAHTHTHTLCTHSPPSSLLRTYLFPSSTYTSPHLPTFPQSLSIAPTNMPVAVQQRTLYSKPGVEIKLLTVAIDIRRERESKSLQHCILQYTGAKYRFWGEIPVPVPSHILRQLKWIKSKTKTIFSISTITITPKSFLLPNLRDQGNSGLQWYFKPHKLALFHVILTVNFIMVFF